ncbi:VanZ family protein [Sphingobacterium hungaricum]|uniref:Glycine cleavage system protein H n=1 Tax=Sphingobacterium hungaricum TaxID=2082723 RepID=A0A928UYC5_9SPHI|nr:VanZ family protein [Sphingobacterium hungaricum]MBE8713057.1 glycine cleavage system protein H [Sphingobacterium hungaricum]
MRILTSYTWLIVWGVIMLILMGAPPQSLPSPPVFAGFDKLAHCGFFFVFTVLYFRGTIVHSKRRATKIKTMFYALLLSSMMAFGTEAIQFYLKMGRMADWWDIFADYVGIGMAMLAYLLLYQRRTTSYK